MGIGWESSATRLMKVAVRSSLDGLRRCQRQQRRQKSISMGWLVILLLDPGVHLVSKVEVGLVIILLKNVMPMKPLCWLGIMVS